MRGRFTRSHRRITENRCIPTCSTTTSCLTNRSPCRLPIAFPQRHGQELQSTPASGLRLGRQKSHKCHTCYRGLAALWKTQKIATVDQQCRIANRSNRMVFQIVSGRQLWRGKGTDREYLFFKLREFHLAHHSTPEQTASLSAVQTPDKTV